jgi:hypothetical protein
MEKDGLAIGLWRIKIALELEDCSTVLVLFF